MLKLKHLKQETNQMSKQSQQERCEKALAKLEARANRMYRKTKRDMINLVKKYYVPFDYVSFRWDEDVFASYFGVKVRNFANCRVEISSADEILALWLQGKSKPVKIEPGQWVVFKENGSFVGVYTDEEHAKEFEIVADWR